MTEAPGPLDYNGIPIYCVPSLGDGMIVGVDPAVGPDWTGRWCIPKAVLCAGPERVSAREQQMLEQALGLPKG